MSFKEELQTKLGEHEPDQVEELILDELLTLKDNLSEDHKNALELYTHLIHLSMRSIGLKNIKNFPKIPSLQILDLCKNSITGQDLKEWTTLFPGLYKVKITDNEIASLDSVKSFITNKVVKIDVVGNPFVANNANYKEVLFKEYPTLNVIDGLDKDGNEVESTIYEDEGDDGEEFDEEDDGEEFDEEEDGEEFNEDDDGEEFDEEEDEEEEKQTKKRKH